VPCPGPAPPTMAIIRFACPARAPRSGCGVPGSLRRVLPPPSRQGRGCRRPNEDHCRHRCVFKPAPAPAPEYESTPGTAHNRRSGPADRCHTGRDQALHPGQLNFATHSPKTARPCDRKYRSVAGGRSARRPRSPSITAVQAYAVGTLRPHGGMTGGSQITLRGGGPCRPGASDDGSTDRGTGTVLSKRPKPGSAASS
jgi:hypothetical protein